VFYESGAHACEFLVSSKGLALTGVYARPKR
jgi:hypothetical protein